MNNTGGAGYADDGSAYFSDEVLQYNVTSQTWIQVAKLEQARDFHAMTVVDWTQISDYCN